MSKKFYVYMIGSKVFFTNQEAAIDGFIRREKVRNIDFETFVTKDLGYKDLGYYSSVVYHRVFPIVGKNRPQVVRFLKRIWHKQHKHERR